jgi:plasmid stabilization system protein ParE
VSAFAVRLAPVAQDHVRAVRAWWRANRPSAPDLFDEELASAIAAIGELPLAAAPHATISGETVRRVPLRRTRYAVYYYVRTDVVEIVAVWHTSRGGGPRLT